MKMKTLLISLFVFPNLAFSQRQADNTVFERILQYEFQNGSFYIQCEKGKTYFDSQEFKTQNGSEVPEEILTELKSESLRSKDSEWDKKLFEPRSKKFLLNNENV